MKKQEKIFFVQNLAEELKSAKSVVLINYASMDVKTQQKLKSQLKEVDGKMIVVKNTLLKRAGKDAQIDQNMLDEKILVGQNALIIAAKDPVAPIQVLGKFAKEFEIPKLRVGIVDGSFQDETSLLKLSTLPSKDVLLGQVLGALMSPLSGLTNTLSGNLQKLVFVLDKKTKEGEQNG